jgi:hypothetical protein
MVICKALTLKKGKLQTFGKKRNFFGCLRRLIYGWRNLLV